MTLEELALKVVEEVERYIGDVITSEMEPEEATEECWTLCIDEANDLIKDKALAIQVAELACAGLGYPKEVTKEDTKPSLPWKELGIRPEVYNSIPPLPTNDDAIFEHKPGIYCIQCGTAFALGTFSPPPHGIDQNKKPFFVKCFMCK